MLEQKLNFKHKLHPLLTPLLKRQRGTLGRAVSKEEDDEIVSNNLPSENFISRQMEKEWVGYKVFLGSVMVRSQQAGGGWR